jgi:hypothetical protein
MHRKNPKYYILIFIGFILLIHHGYKHSLEGPDSLAKKESCPEACYFQRSDISNHETWILLCFTNAITILLMNGVQ